MLGAAAAMLATAALPAVIPFDDDWRFTLGSFDGSQGDLPSAVAFDDSQWRRLSVPHDWSIEDLAPRQVRNHPEGSLILTLTLTRTLT